MMVYESVTFLSSFRFTKYINSGTGASKFVFVGLFSQNLICRLPYG
jgi:hypothetical protein